MGYTEYNAGHLTGQPRAEDIVIRTPEVFADPPSATRGPTLSDGEAAHFKEHGFIVKRRLIDDSEAFEQALDHLWDNVPRGILRRDEPETWLDAPHERWTDEDVPRVGRLIHGNWKMRSPGRNGIGTEPFLVDRIANHRNMLAIARAFLGAPIKPAARVRGLYAVLPTPPAATGKLGPHADYMAAQLSAMALIHDIEPESGAFVLWPGSHHYLHPHWDTLHGGRISKGKADGFREARDAVLREITPLEFPGSAGDVVFWHPRMLHSAGINRSADPGRRPSVRVVVPCDYERAGLSYFDDEEFGPGEKYQWWVDTRNFHEDIPATPDNIWHGWAV